MDEHTLPNLMGEPNETGLSKQDYMLMHRRCAVCHWPAERWGRWLELHHIVGGPGRKDPPGGENWISLCARCHRCVHDRVAGHPDLPRGAILTAKEQEDGFVDEKLLASLRGRKALAYDKCEIPEEFLNDRMRKGGDPWP